MVTHGHWTPAQINEAFKTILEAPLTLWQAEKGFEEKSPSMLAADYIAKNLDNMIPTHLTWAQWQALWHILKKHFILFPRKLGKLLCKPVHLELTDPNAKPYHGKLYQVPHCSLVCVPLGTHIRVQDILIRGFCVDNFIFILITFKT
jgi:hypothetical protein